MKTIFVLIVLLLFCSILFSQEQIDSLVQKPKKIDPSYQHLIYDYRIPDWGYHKFYINFTSNNSGYNRDSDGEEKRESQSYRGRINPYYRYYKTSEMTTYSLESYFTSDLGYNKYDINYADDRVQKIKRSNLSLNHFIESNLNRYLFKSFYLNFDVDNNYRYFEDSDSRTIDLNRNITKIKRKNINRQYDFYAYMGFGYGRIRNVNPVIKAIRFCDRLNDIKKVEQINSKDIEQLAYLYARQSSFSNTYDRYLKYFYEALPKNISNQIFELEPWELMYLHEVSDEIIGDRYEGSEIDCGVSINHQHYISDNSNPSNSESTLLGIYIEQRYYHNVSTDYQVSTNVYASYSKYLNDNITNDYLGRGFVKLMNLWNITDRMLIDFTIAYQTEFSSENAISTSLDGSESINKVWERSDRLYTLVNLDYFVENNLSLNSLISNSLFYAWPGYSDFNKMKTKEWRISFGIKYYFMRGLL